MNRDRLIFRKLGNLYFERLSDPAGSIESDEGRGDLGLPAGWKKKWSSLGVKQVYLFAESGSEKIERELKKEGLRVELIDPEIIRQNDNDTYLRLGREVHEYLKNNAVVFLYSAALSDEVLSLAAIILIYLRSCNGLALPEEAIRHLTGRTEASPEDRRVYQFKQFINQTYQLPEKLVEKRRSPAVTTVDDAIPRRRKTDVAITPHPKTEFQSARFFNIRNKLISVIALNILGALGTLIFLATFYYGKDSRTRIDEYGLKNTEIVGKMVESECRNTAFAALNTATTLLQSRTAGEKANIVNHFFRNNEQFLFLGITGRGDSGRGFQVIAFNDLFLKKNDYSRAVLIKVAGQNLTAFRQAVRGTPVIRNVSPGLPFAVLGLGLAMGDAGDGRFVIALFQPVIFLPAVKSTELIKTFLVDGRGDVMAHEDGRLLLAGANFGDRTVVKTMMQSRNANGKISFSDESGRRNIGFFKKLSFAGMGIASTVEEEIAFQAVNDMQRRNIYILIIVLTGAVIFVFFFARTISIPVNRLVDGTRQIEAGNFDIDIRPSTRDEIGSLTHSFYHMAHGLGERERLKDAFGRFVNPEIARQVESGEIKLGGEKKECAIFFSDLRGFTAMSEKMTPEQVVEFLNEYFTGMVRCVTETNGIVDKYIGDAVMAHWGALTSHGNDTENAVNGALRMRKFLIEFNRHGEGRRPFARFGCGINSGPVISGQIGSEDRMEFTVIGDAVNLASRIEALNKPFGTDILISSDSYELVKDIFQVEAMPAIKVKGKEEPQIIYAVLGRKDDPDCPHDMNEVRKVTGGEQAKVDLADFQDEKEEKFEVIEK